MVDPQDDDPEDGGGRGEDHHSGVVDAEDGRVVSGRDPTGDRHQEDLDSQCYDEIVTEGEGGSYCHVQHGGDTQGHLLARLGRDEEDKARIMRNTNKPNCQASAYSAMMLIRTAGWM